MRSEIIEVACGRQLRFVAFRIDHAQKAQRHSARGAELMPGAWRYGNEIKSFDREYRFVDERFAFAA